jgi:hypothetical protein
MAGRIGQSQTLIKDGIVNKTVLDFFFRLDLPTFSPGEPSLNSSATGDSFRAPTLKKERNRLS